MKIILKNGIRTIFIITILVSIFSCSKPQGEKTVIEGFQLLKKASSSSEKVEDSNLVKGDIVTYYKEKEDGKESFTLVESVEKQVKGWIPSDNLKDGQIKFMTVIIDGWLMEEPEVKKIKWVKNAKLKRSEIVELIEEKKFEKHTYTLVKIDDTEITGWIRSNRLYAGILETVTISSDAKVYMRPNEKSDTVGRPIKAGISAFILEDKDEFIKIQIPGREGYILKSNISTRSNEFIIKNVNIEGLGKAIVDCSSQLITGTGKELYYDVRNAFDGKFETTWAEGKDGEKGVGEWISLAFDNYINISSVGIVNGYAKSEELYYANVRIAQIRITSDNGSERVIDLEDDVLDFQNFEINITGKHFKFQILKIYDSGIKYSDASISEIKLSGAIVTEEEYEEEEYEEEDY